MRCKACKTDFQVPAASRASGGSSPVAFEDSDQTALSPFGRRTLKYGLIAGVTFLVLSLGIFFAGKGINNWRERQQIEETTVKVNAIIRNIDHAIKRYDFGAAKASVSDARLILENSGLPSHNFSAVSDQLNAASVSVVRSEADYNDKVSKGWVIFEGNLIPADRKKDILAQRQRQEEDRKRIADQKRREEAEARRSEELAALSVTIKGSGWLTFGSGRTELLRGLQIYLIKRQVPETTFRPFLGTLDSLTDEVIRLKNIDVKTSRQFDRNRNSNSHKELKDNTDREIKLHQDLLMMLQVKAKEGTIAAESLFSRLRSLQSAQGISGQLRYRFLNTNIEDLDVPSTYDIVSEDEAWPHVVRAMLIGQVKANSEGKFQFNGIKAGEYCIYAMYKTAFIIGEWCIPVVVDSPVVEELILDNDNTTIANRHSRT